MEIKIHSFHSLVKLAEHPFEISTAVISIGDYKSSAPILKYQPDYLLRLEFDDMEPHHINDYETSGEYAFRLFSSLQAAEIVEFVKSCRDKSSLLICQCQHGISRSSAVAAAISQYYGQDGIRYFIDSRYHPNLFVFSLLMKAFEYKA